MVNVTGIPSSLRVKSFLSDVRETLNYGNEWAMPVGGAALGVGLAALAAGHPAVAQVAFTMGAGAAGTLAIGGVVGKVSDLCVKASDFVKASPDALKNAAQMVKREHERFSQEYVLQGWESALKDFARRHYPSAREFARNGWNFVWKNKWSIAVVAANICLMDAGADMLREMVAAVPSDGGDLTDSFRCLTTAMVTAMDPTNSIEGVPIVGLAFTALKVDKIEEVVSYLQSKFEGDRFRQERHLYIDELAEILSEQRGWVARTSLYERAERRWHDRQAAVTRGEQGVVNYPRELLDCLQTAAGTGKKPEDDGVTSGAVSIIQRFGARLERRLGEVAAARTPALRRAGPSV